MATELTLPEETTEEETTEEEGWQDAEGLGVISDEGTEPAEEGTRGDYDPNLNPGGRTYEGANLRKSGGFGGPGSGDSEGRTFAEGEGSDFLGEDDYWDAYNDFVKNEEAYNAAVDEYWAGDFESRGISLKDFLSGKVWDLAMDAKGLGLEETRAQAMELKNLRDRDKSRWWEDQSDWEKDLDTDMRKSIRELAARSAYGGNRMLATKALSNAASHAKSKMIDFVMEGREEESRIAGVELKNLLHAAAQKGEAAAINTQNMLNQFRMQRAQQGLQEEASWLAFAGTLLAGVATVASASVSDERLKDVTGEDTSGAAYSYLDQMRTAQYDMPGFPAGRQNETGVMAQSLEGTRMGKESVKETSGGAKMIDPIEAQRNTMVAQKEMHERLKMLERHLGINRSSQQRSVA